MWKQMKSDITTLTGETSAYFYRIRYSAFALFIYTVLLHLKKFSYFSVGIDTERVIDDSEGVYDSWLGIGRQGLIFLKKLMRSKNFSPDFAVLLTIVFLVLVCLLVPLIAQIVSGGLGKKTKAEPWIVLGFGMLAVSHPILTEQLYFTLQSAEVTAAFLMVAASLLAVHFWAKDKNVLWLIIGVALLPVPFSVYQAMVPLFVAGAVCIAFLRSITCMGKVSEQIWYVVRMIIAFLLGFALNQIITQVFFAQNSYLWNQIYWSADDPMAGVHEIYYHIRDVVKGSGTFYMREFALLWFALIVLAAVGTVHQRRQVSAGGKKAIGVGEIVWRIFLIAALFLAPFYLTVLLGMRPVTRAELVQPFAMAFVFYFAGVLLLQIKALPDKRKVFTTVMCAYLILISFVGIYQEAHMTSRLYYADDVRAHADVALANQLNESIQEFTGQYDYSGKVVFLGRREAVKNASCIDGGVMGQSFFNWDTDVEPLYYYSSGRIVGFMRSLGMSYEKPAPEDAVAAAEYMDEMSCYPAEGSMIWLDDMVVIKLSDR